MVLNEAISFNAYPGGFRGIIAIRPELPLWPAASLLAGALAVSPVHAGPQAVADTTQAQAQRNRVNGHRSICRINCGRPDVLRRGIYRGRQDLIERAINPLSARPASPIRPTVHNLWAEGKRHHLLGWGDNDQRWQAVSQQLCVDLQNARWTGSTGDGISGFGGV
jgi:hypothetical protein